MMSSRSIIWTLTEPIAPSPSPTMYGSLARDLQEKCSGDNAQHGNVADAEGVLRAVSIFGEDMTAGLVPTSSAVM